MKNCFELLVVLVISGWLAAGCVTAHPAKTPAHRTGEQALEEPESHAQIAPKPLPHGKPEALAHFATGLSYELNDQSELALQQFEISASQDPANEALVIELARRYLDKHQTQKALDLLAKSARRPDVSAELLNWQARACAQSGSTNKAIEICELAIKRAPEDMDGYETLAEILLDKKQPAEAIKTLNQAVKKAKAEPAVLVDLAEIYGDIYDDARTPVNKAAKARSLDLLGRAEALEPVSVVIQQRLADAYRRIDEPKKATAIYLKMLEAYPEPSLARDALREKLANIYLQNDDKKGAAEQLQAIVRNNPTRYPQAWYFLGTIAASENKFTLALENIQKALLLNPEFEQAYYELALVQIDLHRTDDAIKTLEQAGVKFPNTFAGEFFNGLAQFRLKNYADAVKHFIAAEIIARATDPKRLDGQFYFQLGAACERNGDFKQAEDCLQKAIQMEPDFSTAQNYLGYMWAERGQNLSKARELIEKALKIEPNNSAYLDSMGWVLYRLNQPRQALSWLQRAMDLSKDEPDPTVLHHLGDVYMALHQVDQARDCWQKSLALESNDTVKKKLEAAAKP
jgi:tetratricopeptide (TPR) repeat protein